MESNNSEQEYLSKKITNLFLQNYKRVSYCLYKTTNKTYNKRNLVSRYEGKFNIVCHPRINSWKIINTCSGCHFWIWKRHILLSLVLYHLQTLLSWRKNVNMEFLLNIVIYSTMVGCIYAIQQNNYTWFHNFHNHSAYIMLYHQIKK